MDVADAALYFDQDPVTDGYTGSFLFYAQVASFDDSSSDGATVRRRVMSAAPTITMPTRKVVGLYGGLWLAGRGTPDGFQGQAVRQHFNMKRVTDTMAVLTPEQARAASAGTSCYVHKLFLKDIVNSLTDNEYDPQFNIFIAPGETARKGSFLRDADGVLYRVRSDYLPADEVRVLQADQLDTSARVSATFHQGTYNPVTGDTSVVDVASYILVMDTPQFYKFRHLSDERIRSGDITVFAATSLNVAQGHEFTFSGVRWTAVTVQPEADVTAIHARAV